MKRWRAIIFDFGGVVIRWDPRRIFRRSLGTDEAISAFFREVGFHEWNLEQDRGRRGWTEAVAELSARFPHRADLIRAYHERWEESIAGPIDGTVHILERLHAAGQRLVGLTNWSLEKFLLTRERFELFRLFDEIVVSGEVGWVKPEREIFDLTLERTGLRAEECIFIDDHPPNVAAAAALGFHAIRFTSPEQLEEELRREGVLP